MSPLVATMLVATVLAQVTGASAATLDDLADRLIGRSRSHVRSRAITEMEKLDPGGKAALAPLVARGFHRREAYERMNAAYAFGLLDEHARPTREQLTPLLTDPSEMVRQQARAALARLGEGRAGAVGAEIAEYRRLRRDQGIEAEVARRSAIGRLAYVLSSEGERPPEGVATLTEALADSFEYARHAAASGLLQVARVACADVLPATTSLLGAMRDADRNTAHGALRVLETVGLVPTDPAHGRAAFSRDAATRRALAERLDRVIASRTGPPPCTTQAPPKGR